MHLTIEVRAFTWHEVFAHAVAQALPDEPILRRGLPPGFADGAAASDVEEAIRAVQPELLGAALAAIDEERLVTALGDLADRFVYTRSALTGGRLAETDLLADATGESGAIAAEPAHAIEDGTRFRIRPGIVTRLRPAGDKLRLFFSGDVVELPERCRSMLEDILARRRFAVREIPAPLGPDSRRMLLRHLVRAGVLTFEVASTGAPTVAPTVASMDPQTFAQGARA